MATTSIRVEETPLVLFTLRRADDALVLGHRLSEWCGHAPTPEEDIALANMGLDLLGQARSLLAYAGEVEGAGRGEDALAYLRAPGEYRNVQLVELPGLDAEVEAKQRHREVGTGQLQPGEHAGEAEPGELVEQRHGPEVRILDQARGDVVDEPVERVRRSALADPWLALTGEVGADGLAVMTEVTGDRGD